MVGNFAAEGTPEKEAGAGSQVEEAAGEGRVEVERLVDGKANGTEKAVLVEGEQAARQVLREG